VTNLRYWTSRQGRWDVDGAESTIYGSYYAAGRDGQHDDLVLVVSMAC
jgi:hypothetical protein